MGAEKRGASNIKFDSGTHDEAARDRSGEVNALLAARLRDALAAGADGALSTVLELRKHSPPPPSPVGGTRRSNPLVPPPQVYVAIYVNGRLACRTRSQTWDSLRGKRGDILDSEDASLFAMAGVVTLNETFRLRLPHFPVSVTARVLESRPLHSWLPVSLPWGDEPLSAHPVPIVVPGSDEVRAFTSSSSGAHDSRHDQKGYQRDEEGGAVWIPAASVGASHERYQFSTAADLPRSKWHRSLQDSPALAACARRVQGRVVISAAWIPSTSGGGGLGEAATDGGIAYLPPATTAVVTKSSSQGNSTPVIPEGSTTASARGWSTPQLVGRSCSNQKEHGSTRADSDKTAAFALGRGFKRHVTPEELAVDANDPADARVARIQRSIVADRAFSPLISDVFRCFPDRATPTETLLLTKRNQLLRLRDRERRFDGAAERSTRHSGILQQQWQLSASRAVLLQEPIPLLDAEILANEAYLRLLRPELRAFDRELLRERAGIADTSVTTDRWSVRGRHERQRLALLEFLDRVEDAARRFALDSTSTFIANDPASSLSSERPLALASIIQEQPLPLFPGAFELPALGDLFARRRKLRPRATARRSATSTTAVATSAHWPMHCELYIQVLRASNVPLRMKPRHASGNPSSAGGGSGVVDPLTPRRLRRQKEATRRLTVGDDGAQDDISADATETPRDGSRTKFDFESRVFVEVSFQGRTRRTTCCLVSVNSNGANGATAEWMETLVLPFRAPEDDWDPAALAKVRNTVRLRLYDRVVRSEASEDAILEKNPALGAKDKADQATSRLGKRAIHEEHCLLGNLEVPFATLHSAQGLVDAPLRCVTPVEHLGYANVKQGERAGGGAFHSVFASSTASSAAVDNQRRHDHDAEDEEGGDDDGDGDDDDAYRVVRRSERDATYLHVMMTLSPLLPPPPVPSTSSASNPSTSSAAVTRSPAMVLRDAAQWVNSLGLPTSVVACYLRHGPALVTQLLGAQQSPPGLATVPEVVHFVRCLPLVDDWRRAMMTDGDMDGGSIDSERQLLADGVQIAGENARDKTTRVWASSQDCLDLCAGDRYEHAVLLHNYLAWLDLQQYRDSSDTKEKQSVFLIFGRVITDGGDAVFVLWKAPNARRNGGVLWDATTGVGCHASSEHCPLRQVFLAVSSDNAFANIQRLQPADRRHHRDQFNWDVDGNPKCWKPLFGFGNAMPSTSRALLPCLQHQDLSYTTTPPEYVAGVERELHDTLKLAIRRWRSAHSTTVFNLSASLKVRAHLELLKKQQALGVDLASMVNNSEPKAKKRGGLVDQAKASAGFLLELQRTHDVAGVPVHVGFMDIPSVVRVVKDMVRRV